MIDYNKIEDVLYFEIAKENKAEYARIFRYEKPTVKEFCYIYLDGNIYFNGKLLADRKMSPNFWGKFKRLKQEYVEKELIPYLIRVGALVPSVKDPIKYALITVPALNKQKERTKNLTVEDIGKLYFDKDCNIIERSKNDLSIPNVGNMLKYYKYLKLCVDCDPVWLQKVEKTLKDYGIISEFEQNV